MILVNHYHPQNLFILKRLENRQKLRLLDKRWSILSKYKGSRQTGGYSEERLEDAKASKMPESMN